MKAVEGVLVLLLTLVLLALQALISTLFIWAGWNLGVVDASGDRLPDVSLGTAFWLSVFGAAVGGFFKSKLETKKE